MNNIEQIRRDKEKIRKALRNGTANGIVGVGINPLIPELLVFYSDEMTAREALRRILEGAPFVPVSLLRVKIRERKGPLPASGRERNQEPAILFPGSEIEPEEGLGGRVGCFVSLRSGKRAVLTAEHLFHSRKKHSVCITHYDDPSLCTLAGTSMNFGGLKALPEVSSVDCATFLPSENVSLEGDSGMTDVVLDSEQLSLAINKKARRLGGEPGLVLDTDAVIKYKANLGGPSNEEVLLDHQVLIQETDEEFGAEGDSGSLVVLDEQAASYEKGTGLGLYIAIIDSGEYHFVTPLHACLEAIRATGIHLPTLIHSRKARVTKDVFLPAQDTSGVLPSRPKKPELRPQGPKG